MRPQNATINPPNTFSISGSFCVPFDVSQASSYELDYFLPINLTVRKMAKDNRVDSNLNGIVDFFEKEGERENVIISSLDSDEDGIPDFVELLKGLNPTRVDANEDGIDQDQIQNLIEIQRGNDPSYADSNSQEISFSLERMMNLNDPQMLGCGVGQPIYNFQVLKMPLLPQNSFEDHRNSPIYSLTHNEQENIVLLMARMLPQNIDQLPIYLVKLIKMPVSGSQLSPLKATDFTILDSIENSCPSCVDPNNEQYLSVHSGFHHTCAITVGRNVRCWGNNSYGQLGNGTTISKTVPALVLGPLSSSNDGNSTNLNGSDSLTDVQEIVMGDRHTCALLMGGSVYCWGSNIFGQLGNGTGSDSLRPVKVQFPTTRNVRKITSGSFHSCALIDKESMVTSREELYCWGKNDKGQLGNERDQDSPTPSLVSLPSSIINIDSIDAKMTVTYLISEDLFSVSSVYFWGFPQQQSYIGTYSGIKRIPTKIDITIIPSGTEDYREAVKNDCLFCSLEGLVYLYRVSSITIDGNRSFCEILDERRDPPQNQLPLKALACFGCKGEECFERRQNKDYVETLFHVKKISSGSNHICVINREDLNGILTDVLRCGGKNESGQIGDGTLDNSYRLNLISSVSSPLSVSSGVNYTCAISIDRRLWCWGSNTYGQLGIGSLESVNSPQEVR